MSTVFTCDHYNHYSLSWPLNLIFIIIEKLNSCSNDNSSWRTFTSRLSNLIFFISELSLTHSKTFLFWPSSLEWHNLFCTWRFIPPTHKTFASAAPKLCSRITYLKKFYSHRISRPPIANTIISRMQLSIFRQYKILHDMIHMTIRIVLELVLVISSRA